MKKITKITKQEAKITAKLFIINLLKYSDGFSTYGIDRTDRSSPEANVDNVIQEEIEILISKLRKGLENTDALSSYDCISEAKRVVREAKERKDK